MTSGGSLVWTIAAGLTGPIFQGGRILENYRAHIAVWEQAKAQYQQTVLTAFREVADRLAALAKLAEAETGQERSVKGLEAAVGLAMDRYLYGLASYYEVLDAQQRLYPAQNGRWRRSGATGSSPTSSSTRRSGAAGTSPTPSGPGRAGWRERRQRTDAARWSTVDRAGRQAGLPWPHGRTEAVPSTVTVGRSAWTESRSGSRWPWPPAPWPRRFLSTHWP